MAENTATNQLAPSIATISEDLSLSNMEGTGVFQYFLKDGKLVAVHYSDFGEVDAAFELNFTARELPVTEDILDGAREATGY